MDWYPHQKIEQKWQRRWFGDRGKKTDTFRAEDGSSRPKAYVMIEFPYPSGEGLHVGHARSYSALDAVARKLRMQGKNVLFPIGWDAFGLPTENHAIKSGIHPAEVTKKNTARYKEQLQMLGISFDWSREINTTDPAYYKWTQWIFLQFFKRGLAYQATIPINWCPKDKIGLANEEVVGGRCERCGTPVTRKLQKQWLLKITAYADRLLKDLDTVDYLEKIKTQQVNWIGRSEGAEVQFKIENGKLKMQERKVLVATNNPSKVARVRKLLAHALPDVALVTPKEAGLESVGVEEGSDLAANAEAKARAYLGKTDLPVLGMDTGLFIDGVKDDPARVKRNALGGVDESTLSSEEVGAKMNAYYRDLAREHGGEVPGYFLDSLALVHPDGSVQRAEAKRELILTDKQKGKIDWHFPIRCLYRIKATGKYAVDQTEQEEIELDLAPLTQALLQLLAPSVTVFTTRPDTLFGATYLVLAPEHPLVDVITTDSQRKAIQTYRDKVAAKSDLERTDLAKEKTGVFTGAYAINPVNQEKIPVWIADYVLLSYGTGAIMAVPAHDERDWEFAKKFRLPIRQVITPLNPPSTKGEVWTGEGKMVNSGEFSNQPSEQGRKKITGWLAERGLGKAAVQYKLRDWVFSRQRYWGEPIPVVHCPKHGSVPVPEDQLPVELPRVERYQPTDTGESPLAAITNWVNTTCPDCGGPAKRETDTMPNWAGSSWYFLRYTDPNNDTAFADLIKLDYWMPVDLYNGGMEHTVLHLLYSRFWYKFLADQGLVPGNEPYRHRHSHGLVLAEDGQKMSKSRGNVINPDDLVREYGADSLRVYEMFMGPFEEAIPWSTRGIVGVHRFLQGVYDLVMGDRTSDGTETISEDKIIRIRHKTVKRVTDDLELFKFNTAVSALMEFANALKKADRSTAAYQDAERTLLLLLACMAPYLVSELWEKKYGGGIVEQAWPTYDPAKLVESTIPFVVQVNGKVRAQLTVSAGLSQQAVEKLALDHENVRKYVMGSPKKVIFVPNKLINFVI